MLFEAATHMPTSYTQNGNFGPVGRSVGQISAGAGSSDALLFTFPRTAQQIGAETHSWLVVYRLNSVATRGGLFSIGNTTGGDGVYGYVEAAVTAARYSVRSWATNMAVAPAYTIGKLHALMFTYDPVSNAVGAYQDGRSGTAATEATTSTSTDTLLYLADVFPGFSRELNGGIEQVAYWDRAFSAAEAEWITRADNWRELLERGRDGVMFAPAAAGGAFKSAWAANSTVTIGAEAA